jgi:hypothetical protein
VPLTYINSIRAVGTTHFKRAFHWMDDLAEDQAVLDFALDVLNSSWNNESDQVYRNLVVDRSGSVPTARWDLWEPTGPGGSYEFVEAGEKAIGPADSYWAANQSSRDLGIGPMDMELVYWECDERGRAFSIDDLVVPGPPKITGLDGSVSSARELTLWWDSDDAFVAYEVHEFIKVPEATLKATVTEPTRTSDSLEQNQTLEYAVRGKTATDELGPFSNTVIVTIGTGGGTVEPGGEAPA